MRISDWSSDVCSSDLGASSSQRHWHEDEDEMVIMLSGEAILVDNNGRTVMRAGDVAAFPKDDGNGHVLVNESEADCCFVAVGRPASGDCHYPDTDMPLFAGKGYRRKIGRAPSRERACQHV